MAMFSRRSYIQGPISSVMDEMEFTEAESNIDDLISEYQQYRAASSTDRSGETIRDVPKAV
jgi:tubulin beta